MLYTLISFLLILFILLGLTWFNRIKTDPKRNDLVYLSIKHTDILKGIAIIFVVISHIANFRGFPVLIPLGGIGVALFLLCSGYGLNESYKKKGLEGFFKNRLIKILIPYWVMVILYWLFHMDSISFSKVVGSFIMTHELPNMWFIYFIFIWYILFYFSKRIFSDLTGNMLLIITGVILIFVFKDTTWGEQSLSFVAGVLISQSYKIKEFLSNKTRSLIQFLVLGIVFSGVFLALKLNNMDIEEYYWLLNIVLLTMKLSLALFIVQFTFTFKNHLYRSLATVGLYSYELYLIHSIFVDWVKFDNNYYFVGLFFVLLIILSFGLKKVSVSIDRVMFKKQHEVK